MLRENPDDVIVGDGIYQLQNGVQDHNTAIDSSGSEGEDPFGFGFALKQKIKPP